MDAERKVIACPQIGTILRIRREQLGLTLSQVAEETRISERFLQSIEDTRFHLLPEPAFVRGYMRRYSNHVGLPLVQTVGLYDDWMFALRQEDERLAALAALQRQQRGWQRYLIAVSARLATLNSALFLDVAKMMAARLPRLTPARTALIASMPLVMALGVHVVSDEALAIPLAKTAPTAGPVAALPEPAEVSAVLLPAAAPESAPEPEPVAMPTTAPVAPTRALPAVTPVVVARRPDAVAAPVAAPLPPARPHQAIAAGIDTLSLEFSQPSWVQVLDATGTQLIYGLQGIDRRISVFGKPPFQIKVGNPQATRLALNGIAVDIAGISSGTNRSLKVLE